MSVMKTGDYENLVTVLSCAALLVIAIVVGELVRTVDQASITPIGGRVVRADPRAQPSEHAKQARQAEIEMRFQQAVVMLHARQYEHAMTALTRVLQFAPRMAEAHVNMGYALLGMEEYGPAHDYFQTATEIQPFLANAYYGLALAYEGMGEYEGAIGAMRSYIHLSREDSHIVKARAAIWEWELKLGRIPPVDESMPAISFADRDKPVTGEAPGADRRGTK